MSDLFKKIAEQHPDLVGGGTSETEPSELTSSYKSEFYETLAAEHPELYKRVARSKPKVVLATDFVRVSFISTHGEILVEQMPEKGLRRCGRSRYSIHNCFSGAYNMRGALNAFLAENIISGAKLKDKMKYTDVCSAINKALESAKKEAKDVLEDWHLQSLSHLPYEDLVYFTQVRPNNIEPMNIEGADFNILVKWDSFEAKSPNYEAQHEGDHQPSGSVIQSKSAGGARKLYKILAANNKALKKVKWLELSSWLSKKKIGSDSWSHTW